MKLCKFQRHSLFMVRPSVTATMCIGLITKPGWSRKSTRMVYESAESGPVAASVSRLGVARSAGIRISVIMNRPVRKLTPGYRRS